MLGIQSKALALLLHISPQHDFAAPKMSKKINDAMPGARQKTRPMHVAIGWPGQLKSIETWPTIGKMMQNHQTVSKLTS
jgi:hypothetical protein